MVFARLRADHGGLCMLPMLFAEPLRVGIEA